MANTPFSVRRHGLLLLLILSAGICHHLHPGIGHHSRLLKPSYRLAHSRVHPGGLTVCMGMVLADCRLYGRCYSDQLGAADGACVHGLDAFLHCAQLQHGHRVSGDRWQWHGVCDLLSRVLGSRGQSLDRVDTDSGAGLSDRREVSFMVIDPCYLPWHCAKLRWLDVTTAWRIIEDYMHRLSMPWEQIELGVLGPSLKLGRANILYFMSSIRLTRAPVSAQRPHFLFEAFEAGVSARSPTPLSGHLKVEVTTSRGLNIRNGAILRLKDNASSLSGRRHSNKDSTGLKWAISCGTAQECGKAGRQTCCKKQ